MAVNVATLQAKLTADTRGLKKGLDKAGRDVKSFEKKTTGATRKAASSFGGIGKAAAGLGLAFGAAQVVSFAGNAVRAFSDLEESVNAVNVVYGEQADLIAELGLGSAETFGLTTTEVNDAAVAMGAFVEKIDEANPADAFGNIIQRATDFASVMNLETGEALDKFRSGLAGESEPLRKFGIDISEATIKQVALDAGIIKTGETMTQTQKVQARYLAIMQQTEKSAGDFANTSDGLANSQKILSAKWKEAQIELGKRLAPAMTKLLEAGVALIPVFTEVVGVVGDLFDTAQPLIDLLAAASIVIGDVTSATGEAEESTSFWDQAWGSLKDTFDQTDIGQVAGFVNDVKDAMDSAEEATVDLGTEWDNLDPAAFDGDMATLGLTIEKTGGKVTNFWKESGKAAVKVGDFATSTKAVRLEVLKLTNPVFAANRAIADYAEALEDANEKGGITEQELRDLAPLWGEAEAASAALTGDNLAAYQRLIGEVGDDAGALPGVIKGAFASADAVGATAFPNVQGAIDRLESLFKQSIDIKVTAEIPTADDFDRAISNAIARRKRNGDTFIN